MTTENNKKNYPRD